MKSNSDNKEKISLIDEVFSVFNGNWQIKQYMHNYHDHTLSGFAQGTGMFYQQQDASILLYENIVVNWNCNQNKATKAYLFEIKNDSIKQYMFNRIVSGPTLTEEECKNKIYMHKLCFSKDKNNYIANSTYNCNSDSYKLYFTVESNNKFSMEYSIKGSDKNSLICTEFYKLDDDSSLIGDYLS